MKKKHFRISLYEGRENITFVDTLIRLAARANGGASATLDDMETVAKGHIIQFPVSNLDVSVERIGDDLLHIDAKVEDEYKTILSIREVEIWDVVHEDEAIHSLQTDAE